MENNEKIQKLYKKFIDTRTEDKKDNLYPLIIQVILSKEFFKSNHDLGEFLKKANIDYKEYVIKSRTLTLSRIIRDIESSQDLSEFRFLLSEIENLSSSKNTVEKELSNKEKKAQENNTEYYRKLLQKYLGENK